MRDSIDRQDAIDAARKAMLDFFDFADDVFIEPLTYTEEKFLLINKSIATRLEALPPVQSNTCDGCKWDSAIGYGECHHCKRAFSDMYEEEAQDE